MRTRLIVAIALAALASKVSAAPIQGILNAETGNVIIQGFTGEIFGALRGSQNLLLPANAQPNLPYTLDATLPGEIAFLGLGGINGQLNLGNVVKPGLSIAELSSLKIVHQVSFTSEVVELPMIFLLLDSSIPEQPGFFVIVPEPASCSLLLASAGTLWAANRRWRGLQHRLVVQ